MTIVVNVEDSPLEQVTKQLNKLVEVIKIVELDGSASVNRELLLVKVKADADTRGQVLDVVELFQAKVVDVSPDTWSSRRSATSTSSPTCAAARAVRHPRARPVRHGRHRPRLPLHLRAHPAPGRRPRRRGLNPVTGIRPGVQPPNGRTPEVRTPQKERPPWPRCSTTTTPTCPDPGQERGGARLRQPGPRARAVAARLRRRRPVGLPEGSKSRAKAEAEGLRVSPRPRRSRRPTSS
jgi:hypothetical protein